jgi:3-phenylpropionate/cinnamic acid dioxygenase small subunit
MMTNMPASTANQVNGPAIERLLLQYEVETFLAAEYELLDERKFDDWLELFADDARYWMPLARNFKYDQPDEEYTRERADCAWFDEDKHTLGQRIRQIKGGDHWAEEPLSRTTHLVAGIRIASANETQLEVRSRFVVYANRNEREVQLFVGKRLDTLRRHEGSFRIAGRAIHLDQHVLLAKSITTFF